MKINKSYLKRKCKKMEKCSAVTEYILYIALLAVLLAMVFVLYNSARTDSKAQKEKTNMASIRASVQAIYSGALNYSGLNNASLIKAGAIPNDMVSGNSGIINSFGGSVTVSAGTRLNGSKGFTIASSSVPTKECIRLINGFANVFDELGVSTMGNIKSGLTANNPSISTVNDACNYGTSTIYLGVYD